MDRPLDGVNIRDARRDVLRLDDQARQTWDRGGLALVRLLGKVPDEDFAEMIAGCQSPHVADEAHGRNPIGVPGKRPGERGFVEIH